MSFLVMVDKSHEILKHSKVLYCGHSPLPTRSLSLVGPRSTPGLPGMFEIAEMLYYPTMVPAKAV